MSFFSKLRLIKLLVGLILFAFSATAATEQWIVVKAKVPGMTCQSCVQSITSALLKHHYQFASVNIETKLVEAKLPLEDKKKMVLTDAEKETLKKQITAVIATAGSQYKVEAAEFSLAR